MVQPLASLVVKYQIDAKKALAGLDKILINLRRSKVNLIVANTAVARRDGAEDISLYPLLDKGTVPHDIGDKDTILANEAQEFGPIHGPVHHPGTESHDISARVFTYVESLVQAELSSLGASGDNFIKFTEFEKLFEEIGRNAVQFAQDITPDIWTRVKDGFKATLGDRRIDG